MDNIFTLDSYWVVKLFLALVLGGLIGWERERYDHPAGFRTHILVSLGSALFTLVSIDASLAIVKTNSVNSEPMRLAAQIIPGIGFLGAGTIFRHGSSVSGLTTAASLWVVAGVGMACGVGYFWLAGLATLLTWVSLEFLDIFEGFNFKRRRLHVLRVTAVGATGKLKEIADLIVLRGGVIRKIKVDESPLDDRQLVLVFVFRIKKGVNFTDLYEEVAKLAGVTRIKAR
ncbi:MAG: hypothetical protein RLZ12_430 [Bacillota bacterium]|jgi:putative Mg2+ transporter-C (MgtC) family protein